MKQILESDFPGIDCLSVTREGDCLGYKWQIKWSCKGGDKNELIIQHKAHGNRVEAKVRTLHNGGMLFGPLTGEFLQVAEKTPQVRLVILPIGMRNIPFLRKTLKIDARKFEQIDIKLNMVENVICLAEMVTKGRRILVLNSI